MTDREESKQASRIVCALAFGLFVGLWIGATLRNFPESIPEAEAQEPVAVPPGSLGADVFMWRRDAEGVTGVRLVGHGWHVSTKPPSYGEVQ